MLLYQSYLFSVMLTVKERLAMNSGFCLSWNTSGNTISLAQSAFLFSLSRRGNSISAIGIRKEACILSASLSELSPRSEGMPPAPPDGSPACRRSLPAPIWSHSPIRSCPACRCLGTVSYTHLVVRRISSPKADRPHRGCF